MDGLSIWLTPDEVAVLTDKKKWKAQCRALAAMGVPFKPNAVGRPLVERLAVCSVSSPTRRRAEPNWSAINGSAA